MVPKNKQQPSDPFVLFVKANENAMVRRHGTDTNIGVNADGKGGIVWDTETIYALTADEVARYGHLYKREIEGTALTKMTREDWEKQRNERKAKGRAAANEAVALTTKQNEEAASHPTAQEGA